MRRGDSASIGLISLALLNIPPALRYLPEHMFMMLIPGPRGPLGPELNHFLRPIIDQLEIAFSPGIDFSQTALHQEGAHVEVAVPYCTADLIAARHLAGLAGATSNFLCSVCNLFGRVKVWDTDWVRWVPRDTVYMRSKAEEWRDAPSIMEQERLWESTGIRWTELWRLPYFDPVHSIVVDPMHCLLEGIVHYYCQHVLKL
jgi:hypothetical protein